MFERMFASSGYAQLTQRLSSWDPFSHKVTGWFDPEWMFGVSGGFDIVVANPPYVSVKAISSEDKKLFGTLFETGKGRFNLFTLFLEMGAKSLKDGGVLTFILPEGLYSHVEYSHIRKYLLNQTSILSVGLFTDRVFEASVDTSVISVMHGKNRTGQFPVIRDLQTVIAHQSQDNFKELPYQIFAVNLTDKTWGIARKVLGASKVKLGEILEFQQGIIYSGLDKDEVFSNEQENDSFKKVLDGRDVLKWKVNWESKKENCYIYYSNKLHRPREERIFLANEKILLPRKSTTISCAYDDQQFYALNTAYVGVPRRSEYPLKLLLAVLNSRLINYYYSQLFFGWQVTIPALDSIAIPEGSVKKQDHIVKLVDQILKLTKSSHFLEQPEQRRRVSLLENDINEQVEGLYQLSSAEIKLIHSYGKADKEVVAS